MLQINGKTFMNLQEAVQWLLDNNALPFQSSANYIANTEIGMGTIVNPSPAKVRIGSLIFFADSKVSTVIGLTENGFICSDQYNDLVDDVVYVSNVALNASGHLIVTLSNGDTIDAGLIKQVNNFSINASQHLIVSFNDGSTTDLGAIFSGNVNIAGNFTANSIIENMAGYSWQRSQYIPSQAGFQEVYIGACKNGNKITFVVFATLTRNGTIGYGGGTIGQFNIPNSVGAKLYPFQLAGDNYVIASGIAQAVKSANQSDNVPQPYTFRKYTNGQIILQMVDTALNSLSEGDTYFIRIEQTFLLSENLAS